MEPSEPSPKIGKRGLYAAFLLTLIFALAGGIFLGDVVLPPDHDSQSVLDTPQEEPSTTADSGSSDPTTAEAEEEQTPKLPTELEALRSNLKQGVPTEQQQRSQAVIIKADALIEQTDGYIAQAGLTTPQTEPLETTPIEETKSVDESALQARIAQARTRLEAVKRNQQAN